MNIKNPLRMGDPLWKVMTSSLHTSLGRWVSAVKKSERKIIGPKASEGVCDTGLDSSTPYRLWKEQS